MIGVYILVGDHDRPIYVGASRDVARRVGEHRRKPWWSEVRDLEVYPQPDWEIALHVEHGLIAEYAPRHNVQSSDLAITLIKDAYAPMAALLAEAQA